MTREEIINGLNGAIYLLEKEPTNGELVLSNEFYNGYAKGYSEALAETLKHDPVLDKIRAEIEQEIEQERFARSVFRGEEKDYAKAEQCTGSIMAYDNVIRLIDKYRTERSEKE